MKKLRVGILFGGRSGEHEVSLLSAASVLNAIDKNKYEVVPIGITKEGRWLTAGDAELLLRGKAKPAHSHLRAGDPEATPGAAVLATGQAVVVPPEPQRPGGSLAAFQTEALTRRASDRAINVDIIFPVLHGTFGEDGTIQGLFELADIAYVGAGVLGSAAGMDKDVMKSLFRAAGLPIVKHVTVLRSDWESAPKKVQKLVESKLKYPVFVKPANLGSSVGISKARERKELAPAMEEAAKFDRKIVIEEGVGGKKHKAREIECLGAGQRQARSFSARRDRSGQRILRLHRQVSRRRLAADHSSEAKQSRNQKDPATGHQRLQGRGLFRPGAGGFPDGPQEPEDLSQRDQHHARIHRDQHVSQAVGGVGPGLSGTDRAPDPAGAGTARREEEKSVQQVKAATVSRFTRFLIS